MGKDPAFLFYPGDWLGGTIAFSRAHKGAYMDLLMGQYNMGHMGLEDIKQILGSDFDLMWETKLAAKFIKDEKGLFYNEKLENEVLRRKKYTDSRKKNLKKTKPHMGLHMENGNETVNKDKSKGENANEKREAKPKIEIVLPWQNTRFENAWAEWKEYRKEEKRDGYKTIKAEQRALMGLQKKAKDDEETAYLIIQESMENGWKGLFELKTKTNGNSKDKTELRKQIFRDLQGGNGSNGN